MPPVVLAAVTGGQAAEKVAFHAAELARSRQAKLVVAHVVDEDFLRTLPGAFGRPEAATHGLELAGRQMLEQLEAKLRAKGHAPQCVVNHGPLLKEIREIAADVGATVLVVGEHKRHFLETYHGPNWQAFQRETGLELVVVR